MGHRTLGSDKKCFSEASGSCLGFNHWKTQDYFLVFFELNLFFSSVSVWTKEKKPNSICLALGTSGNSQSTARCPLPKDAYRIIFLGSKEHVTCPHMAPLPPYTTCSAPPGYKLITTWKCSAMKNLCIDFPVLFVTSWHQWRATSITPLFQCPVTLLKKCNFLQSPDRTSKSEAKAARSDQRRKGAIFMETHYLILVGPTEMRGRLHCSWI